MPKKENDAEEAAESEPTETKKVETKIDKKKDKNKNLGFKF